MNDKIMINDCLTGESFEREMTAEEIAQAGLDAQTLKAPDDLAG
jgi:hypothetical protein